MVVKFILMKTITIYTAGTLGDHLPYIVLARALSKRGYRVRMAVNASMAAYPKQAGVEVIALSNLEGGEDEARSEAWAWDFWQNRDIRVRVKKRRVDSNDVYLSQCRELTHLCLESDLLLATSIRPQGYVAAKASGIPWITISMNPSAFFLPSNEDERRIVLSASQKEYQHIAPHVLWTLSALGISQPKPPFTPTWLWAPTILLAGSPAFAQVNPNQFQPQSSIIQTGFWYYEDPSWLDWQPDEALRRFCEPANPDDRPIVMAFSSQPLEDPRSILVKHALAARILGKKLLVQRGWAGFSEDQLPAEVDHSRVFFCDFLPQDWLFARAVCTIQHGGMGSIARAIRCACPLLVEPFGNDQLFNANRVVELKIGAAIHPFLSTPEEIAAVINKKVLSPECKSKIDQLSGCFQQENGEEDACEAIASILESAPLRGRQYWQRPAITPVQELTESMQEEHPMEPEIPKIIHQTWKNLEVPEDLVVYQQSWVQHHPGWTFTLWSDMDNRELIRTHYAWFLPIYDAYPEAIMRADAARYFILHHFGGVYVDLDFECFRPIEPLLKDKQLVLGLEPKKHLELKMAKDREITKLVCNAFMASTPGHRFWDHLFKQLVAYHQYPVPLDATGPFLLTRAYFSYPHQNEVSIEPNKLLYPITNETPWSELPERRKEQVRRTAYAVHHWRGMWIGNEQIAGRPISILAIQSNMSKEIHRFALIISRYLAIQSKTGIFPRISCLMITHERPELACKAVDYFRRQTYPNRELVIVDDGKDTTLEEFVQNLHDDTIHFTRLASTGMPLGELRNLAIQLASGEYIAQWDDDDISDPIRLELQMASMQINQCDGCLLKRHMIWWPESKRLIASNERNWESSFICRKSCLPEYPALSKGEDTPVIEQIYQKNRVITIDYPQLYTYLYHGTNTFDVNHWENYWYTATQFFEGEQYNLMLLDLGQKVGVDLPSAYANGNKLPLVKKAIVEEKTFEPAQANQILPPPKPADQSPGKILILAPVKDAAVHIPQFVENIKKIILSAPTNFFGLSGE